MYISNFLIVGQGPNYGKYKMINKYDENVSASNLLTRNNPINLLDMYQPNSISDISSLVDSDTTKLLFYNLHKYIYDQTTNPNGPIKKDAITDTLVSTENWHLGSTYLEKLFYISADKTLSTNTINNAGNMIILHPADYYFYYNTGYQSKINIGNKPSNFTFNETTNNYVHIIGNVTTDMINKFESGVFDKPYILLRDCTIFNNVKEALDKIFVMCDDPTQYQFKINDVELNNNLSKVYGYDYLYYVNINQTTSFNFKVLEMDGSLIQQVNITIQMPYVVVGVAGSLNSVGYDESDHREQDNNTEPDRIVQLGYYNDDNLQIIPLGQVAQNLQNMSNVNDPISPAGNYGRERRGTKGIHLPLAKELLKYVPSDYKILVVPVAYGNTGFSSGTDIAYDDVTKKPSVNPQGGNWSLNSAYYMTLRDRIKYALDLNPENKFLGVIWCQGESDADAQVEALKTGFRALVEQLATDWANYADRTINNAVDKSIWYVYETASHWRNTCSQVWKWYKEYLGDSNYTVVAPRAYYTNRENGASSGQGQTPYDRLATYGNNSFITIVAQNVANKLVENKAIYGQLDTQVTNFVGNRRYVGKYWNHYQNSIEASETDNSITFVQCVSSRTPTATSFTLKDNVKELVFTNIKAGVMILLEHTAQGDYSGIVFNNQNAGNNNSNYTTVRGMTDGKRLDNGRWDNNNIANNITVSQKNFTNGRTKIKQISRGVYKFYFNDVEWFNVDLTTNVASLKQNGINESDIIYSIGLMYGYSYSHSTSVIANLSDVVVETQVTT